MKASTSEFRFITGELAYQLFRMKTFNNKKSLNSIKLLHRNLELIVYKDKGIVAYRFDSPENMKRFIENDGTWQTYDKESFSGEIWLNNVRQLYKDLF